MSDDRLRAENDTLRARLAGLTEAILRISGDLDLDAVLQEIVDSARSLTDSAYGAISTMDDAGELQDLLISGMTQEELRELVTVAEGKALLDYLTGFEDTLRTADLAAHTRSVGFPDGYLPVTTFLGTRIRDGDRHIGNIYISVKEGGLDFTEEDEETLEMFARQAAMAITNARRYRDEQLAKADLEALINTSPVGVLVFDSQAQSVVQLNREAARLVACDSERDLVLDHFLQTTTFRRMDGREIPREQLPMERARRTGETVRAEEVVIDRPDGVSVSTLVNATPIRDDDGAIVSVVVTIQDITPLEELERQRAEYLGMVSHELRGPLTAIKGSAATVRSAAAPLDPAEVRQFFRIIEEQADHMRDLINDLLDWSRIEAGNLSMAIAPTDLATLLDRARDSFLSGGHRNSIAVDLMPDLPRVAADGQRIVQVLHNLLSNASRNSHDWSTIRMAVSLEGAAVSVSVIDEGAGIAADRLQLLFSKFSGQGGDGGRRIGGHGLGLAISKGIVEAHGGRIWAESDGEGHGARFTFTLPVAEDSAAAAARPDESPGEPARAPTKLERILLVDDDPQTLRYVRGVLSGAGYETILTDDPDEVERLLEAEKPDLVLLDLVLPGTDGFELLKRIPGARGAPVIFLSGRGGDQYIGKAFEMGAADYVVKPFSPTELLARIKAALQRRAVARQTAPYLLGDLAINYVDRSVTVAGRPVRLTPTEYKLLHELAANAGRALSYDQLLERLWGPGYEGDAQRIRTFVKDLRRKLGDDARKPTYIITAPGVGYRLATE